MKAKLLAVLTFSAGLLSQGAARAQITTVVLAGEDQATFTISEKGNETKEAELKFRFGPPPFPGASVTKWVLRVVPTNKAAGELKRSDQDVTVFSSDNRQVGLWSAFDQTIEPYTTELRREAPVKDNLLTLRLKTFSKPTSWNYHGGGTANTADRPRLIVTYGSAAPPRPPGPSTDWKYAAPAYHFSSRLWSGPELLTNPASYNGAVYMVARSPEQGLYRVARQQAAGSWKLPFTVTARSFASATAWGRLQIITANTVVSCDLTRLEGLAAEPPCQVTKPKEGVQVEDRETPAMGFDGSVYFRNVKADGRIVAYNPSCQEIWRTQLAFTQVSPIALSANERYAFVLAKYTSNRKKTGLVRIDTATGETTEQEISFKDQSGQLKSPDLNELLRPAAASKGNMEYVFVAGNTSDLGLLQLMSFQPRGKGPELHWTRTGKNVATAPALSVVDGNSLFVVQDGSLKRYTWYSSTEGSRGAYEDAALKEQSLGGTTGPRLNTGPGEVLVDGADSVFVLHTTTPGPQQTGHTLQAYDAAQGWPGGNGQQITMTIPNLLFLSDGALIGYNSGNIYDLSPKAKEPSIGVTTNLADRKIFSADDVTVGPEAASSLPDGKQVIFKGNVIKLPKKFRWPRGKILRLQTVPKAS